MTDTTKSEALRLAEQLRDMTTRFKTPSHERGVCNGAIQELRRLHAENEALRADAERYRWLAQRCRSTSEHWGGRWSIVIDGPCPKSHNCEDDFDAAIDAARSKQ